MKDDIKCSDFLAGNSRVYAIKAKRKKIAIVHVEAKNRTSADVRLLLGLSTLTVGGKTFNAEKPESVIRKLGEFTWDFLLYSIIDFHPVTAAIDGSLFLTGPLYNRRLRRQLQLLSADELCVPSGESRSALVAFRGVASTLQRLTIPIRDGNDQEERFDYDFDTSHSAADS